MKNSVQIIGNVGSAPAIVELQGGNLVARFRVATHEKILTSEGKKENTMWHNVVAWGKSARFVEKNLSKGALIALEGKLVTRNWLDSDGKSHEMTEIKMNEILFSGKTSQAKSVVKKAAKSK